MAPLGKGLDFGVFGAAAALSALFEGTVVWGTTRPPQGVSGSVPERRCRSYGAHA